MDRQNGLLPVHRPIDVTMMRGEKMKIHLPGLSSTELAVLTQSF
jgi:hypothetical protein